MVGEGVNFCYNSPRFIPVKSFNINKSSLQFSNAKSRMSVIQLNGYLIREFSPGSVGLFESSNDVLKSGAYEKVLKLQTVLLAASNEVPYQP